MVSVGLVLILVAVAFFCGVAVTLFVGWFFSERFARKPTQKEVNAYKEEAMEQETAWAEGFDSVKAYREWKTKGGDRA